MMRETEFGAHSQPSGVRQQCRPDEHEECRRMRGKAVIEPADIPASTKGITMEAGAPSLVSGSRPASPQVKPAMAVARVKSTGRRWAAPSTLRRMPSHRPSRASCASSISTSQPRRPGNWHCADQQNLGQHGKHDVDRGKQRLPVRASPAAAVASAIQRACRSRASVPSGVLVHDRVALFPCALVRANTNLRP